VRYLCDGRRVRNGEHPADAAEALFRIHQVADGVDLGFALNDPVVAGEAEVQGAVLHVACHLLGADQHAFDVRVVDGREIGSRRRGDLETGASEKVDRGAFEAALWQSEFDSHACS
jgi:hypothetical protein